jgi:2,3-bisphosphoglycerate-dependent phosphoglycerate mutase
MVDLIFETHSISTDNELGIATGWNHGQLSGEGKRLAIERRGRHRALRPAVAITSDLARAVETAELAFADLGVDIVRDPRLRECNYGDMNGMTVLQVDRERPDRVDTPFPGGESYRQVAERVQDFLSDLSKNWQDKRVVAIGHLATKWSLDYLVNGVPLEESVVAPFEWQESWSYSVP